MIIRIHTAVVNNGDGSSSAWLNGDLEALRKELEVDDEDMQEYGDYPVEFDYEDFDTSNCEVIRPKFDPAVNTLYLDCDGVLADFDESAYQILGMNPRRFEKLYGAKAFWHELKSADQFFEKLKPMYDAMELYNAVKHLKPVILTGAPINFDSAAMQKTNWVMEHFGCEQRIIVCKSKDKKNFCKPGDIIVDDWPKHRHLWEGVGGIWVDHRGAEWSIKALQELGVI